MTEPRFTIRWHAMRGWSREMTGWCVCDRGRVITIGFKNFAEALRRRDRIAELYARFGW